MDYTIITKATSELKDIVDSYGAVLLRDDTIVSIEEFSLIAKKIGDVDVDMSCSAGPRIDMGFGVFTSNEAPPNEDIPVHHEMAQCSNPPSYILFFCMVSPKEGGCTPFIHSSKVAQEFRNKFPKLANRLSAEGIRYLREFPSTTDYASPLGKSWKDTYHVSTCEEVECVLQKENIEWEWFIDGVKCDPSSESIKSSERAVLRTISSPVSLFRKYRNKEVFFMAGESSLLKERRGPQKAMLYGNGDELDEGAKQAFRYIGEYARQNSNRIPWKVSDILILNNSCMMHSRDSFTPPRKILVALVK